MAAVLVLIGWRIASGESTVGDFTGFVSALILAAQPIRALGNLNAIVQEAAAALARTFAIMDERPLIVSRPGAPALAVSGGEVGVTADASEPLAGDLDEFGVDVDGEDVVIT